MSGGSFDYLCYAEVLDLAASKRRVFDEMIEHLRVMAAPERPDWMPAPQPEDVRIVLAEMERIRAELDSLLVRLGPAWQRLTPALKAVEWERSGDSGASDVVEHIAEVAAAVRTVQP